MSCRLNVLVLDDDLVTAVSPLKIFLADMPGDADRFAFSTLLDPVKLDAHLDAHKDIDVVLVDVAFDRSSSNSTRTCLTAFDTLIRRNGPQAIGLAQSQYGRTLFPFAVCQLLPPPRRQIVAGWTYKDDSHEHGYPETIRILDEIAAGKGLRVPPTLMRCMPGVVNHTGDFISKILDSRLDVKLWELMSSSYYSAEELTLTAGARNVQEVRRRFDVYLAAIEAFEVAMEHDTIHPLGGQPVRNLPSRGVGAKTGGRDPRQAAIQGFAQNHRTFFQAPELEDIVVQWDLRRSRQAGRRSRKRIPEPWWKPSCP